MAALVFSVNSLWPSDVIWRQGSSSTLAQVMACCLTAPSHYLNQCWLMISEVLWLSPDSNFIENAQDIYRRHEFEIHHFETVVKSPRGQWIKGLGIWLEFYYNCWWKHQQWLFLLIKNGHICMCWFAGPPKHSWRLTVFDPSISCGRLPILMTINWLNFKLTDHCLVSSLTHKP